MADKLKYVTKIIVLYNLNHAMSVDTIFFQKCFVFIIHVISFVCNE